MRRNRWVVPTALLVSVGIVAAACGGDNSGGSSGATTAAAGHDGGGRHDHSGRRRRHDHGGGRRCHNHSCGRRGRAGHPGRRHGQVRRDPSNPNLYVGPSGFTIDLTKCPSDWNINQGITDTEIDIFASYPKSGPLAGFALLYDGMRAYYDYVAKNGGIDGRKIVLDGKDDQYAPAATKTNSDEALAANKYAAFDPCWVRRTTSASGTTPTGSACRSS